MRPRILLINPWTYDFAAFNLWARPLGLLAVAEYLSAFDADLLFIDCMDSFEPGRLGTGKYRSETVPKPALLRNVPRYYKRYGMSVPEFTKRLDSVGPFDVVLMSSVMSYWYPGVQEAIRLVKETNPGAPVILGGIYPTLYPDHAAQNAGADTLFTGPLGDRLLTVLHGFGQKPSPVRAPIPYYKQRLYSSLPFAPLLTSSGCPFQCSYCASRSLSPEYRQKPVDDSIREIRELSAQGVRDFAFYDDALLYGADRNIKPLLEAIVRSGISIRLHAPNGLHARYLDDELAHLMRAAGFTTIRLSLETVDLARQGSTGGKVTTNDLVKSVRGLQKKGFTKEHLGVYLLYGLPGQGLSEVEEGIALLRDLNVRILLAEFSPIRGTACWDDLVKSAVITDDLDPLLTNNTVFSLLYSGYDRAEVERIKIAVKEYNRGESC
jgi:radical SAM superfamily enzyme YgiQ (UPF0313 family)